MGYTKQKLGIDYFSTEEFQAFNTVDDLYGGQLPGGTGPSLHFKVFRNNDGIGGPSCRMQVTYYVRYRGTKG